MVIHTTRRPAGIRYNAEATATARLLSDLLRWVRWVPRERGPTRNDLERLSAHLRRDIGLVD